jgi:hypothetical protein
LNVENLEIIEKKKSFIPIFVSLIENNEECIPYVKYFASGFSMETIELNGHFSSATHELL